MTGPSRPFEPLSVSRLSPQTGYARPFFQVQNPVKVASSAMEVMTDLRFVSAGTVAGDHDLETATQKMVARGVRSLLVTDAHEDVVGIITSRDLLGGRPGEVMRARRVRFAQLRVSDIMTGGEHIEVLQLADVLHARVGDIVATLKHCGRQHALVAETEPHSGKQRICGIFSASQIARQLGVRIDKHDLSDTFADIDLVMSAQSDVRPGPEPRPAQKP